MTYNTPLFTLMLVREEHPKVMCKELPIWSSAILRNRACLEAHLPCMYIYTGFNIACLFSVVFQILHTCTELMILDRSLFFLGSFLFPWIFFCFLMYKHLLHLHMCIWFNPFKIMEFTEVSYACSFNIVNDVFIFTIQENWFVKIWSYLPVTYSQCVCPVGLLVSFFCAFNIYLLCKSVLPSHNQCSKGFITLCTMIYLPSRSINHTDMVYGYPFPWVHVILLVFNVVTELHFDICVIFRPCFILCLAQSVYWTSTEDGILKEVMYYVFCICTSFSHETAGWDCQY